MRKSRQFIGMLLLAAAIITLLPAIRARADSPECGAITSKWTKCGSYSYRLTAKGVLSFKNGDGKARTVAKAVQSARYHGTRVAYTLMWKEDENGTFTPCRIYDCAKKKTVRRYNLKCEGDGEVAVVGGKLLAFYNGIVVGTGGQGSFLAAAGPENRISRIIYDKGRLKSVHAGGYQEGKYFVCISFPGRLEVIDLSNGKTKTVSSRGYSFWVHNGTLYYTEARIIQTNTEEGILRKQNAAVCSCSLDGSNKKKIGSFKIREEDYICQNTTEQVILPIGYEVYLRFGNEEHPAYQRYNCKTKKYSRISKKTFNTKARTKGLVVRGLTNAFDDSLNIW